MILAHKEKMLAAVSKYHGYLSKIDYNDRQAATGRLCSVLLKNYTITMLKGQSNFTLKLKNVLDPQI